MPCLPSDMIGMEEISPLNGSPLVLVDAASPSVHCDGAGVRVAIDRNGDLPEIDPSHFDAMVTTRPAAAGPWVSIPRNTLEAKLKRVAAIVEQSPVATAMLARLLRIQKGVPFESALELESMAYSTLLRGNEYVRWAASANRKSSGKQADIPVRYDRSGDVVKLWLSSPDNRNAMTSKMRDALFEGLVNVLEDPSMPRVELRGEGRCFSTGGDLDEFGSATDLARAHIIRTQRSCARLLYLLGDRASVWLHGACIGSGIEVPSAASRRIGTRDTIIQLPELRMGLIPGAGGTVSVGRIIGRHRMMWLCLGAFRINAKQALDWKLLHEIGP